MFNQTNLTWGGKFNVATSNTHVQRSAVEFELIKVTNVMICAHEIVDQYHEFLVSKAISVAKSNQKSYISVMICGVTYFTQNVN